MMPGPPRARRGADRRQDIQLLPRDLRVAAPGETIPRKNRGQPTSNWCKAVLPAVSLIRAITEGLVTVPYDCDDVALVRALAADDRRAPEVLWRRYKATVFGTLRRVLGPDHETEDLAQDVFLTVYRKAQTIRDGRALPAFVAKVTVQTAHHAIRKRTVRARWLRRTIAESADVVTVAPASCADSRETLPRLCQILDRLRPKERTAFVLRFVDELSVVEVTQKLNVSMATAKRRISHATRRLALHVARDPVLREYRPQPTRRRASIEPGDGG
jgi:RNA polymerase sigma-70 factor (ECF subfamily)